MSGVSMGIAYKLEFNMTYAFKVFLDKKCCLAKGSTRLCGCHFEFLFQLVFIFGKSNTSAPASKGRLEQNWITCLIRNLCCLFYVFYNAIASWHGWNLGLFHNSFAFHLVASNFHSFTSWPDKYYSVLFTHL